MEIEFIPLELFQLNKSYFYKHIEKAFHEAIDVDPNMEWKELGDFAIGESFIVIVGIKTYSFMMDGYNDKYGSSWKLIFKE